MLRKMTACAAVLSAALATTAAQASDIKIYGRIDTGLVYHNYGGDSTLNDSFTLDSGPNTATRIGMEGFEDLTTDTKLIFRLESRFTSDNGVFNSYNGESNRLFGGQSTVGFVNTSFGEMTFGRVAGIASSTGPYDLQAYMDSYGGGTIGTGNAPINSSRHDNMISYRSPWIAGFQATAQFSLKSDSNDEGDESKSSTNRFFDAALHYNVGQLHLIAVYEQLMWGKDVLLDEGTTKDRKVVTLGGSYRFEPATVYVQAQYFEGLKSVDGFSSRDLSPTGSYRDGQIEGYGIYAGTELWFGLSSWKWMVYWRDYALKRDGSSDYDGGTIGISTKFVYRPSKTVDMYVGAGFSRWDRLGTDEGRVKTYTDQDVNVFTGVTKYF